MASSEAADFRKSVSDQGFAVNRSGKLGLGNLAREQGAMLEALGRLAPAVHDVAMRALAAMQPVLQRVAEPWRQRWRQAVQPRHEQEPVIRPSRGPSLGR